MGNLKESAELFFESGAVITTPEDQLHGAIEKARQFVENSTGLPPLNAANITDEIDTMSLRLTNHSMRPSEVEEALSRLDELFPSAASHLSLPNNHIEDHANSSADDRFPAIMTDCFGRDTALDLMLHQMNSGVIVDPASDYGAVDCGTRSISSLSEASEVLLTDIPDGKI